VGETAEGFMIDSLESVLEDAKSWPADDRAELLEVAREIEARRSSKYDPTPEERAAIAEGLEDVRCGRLIEGEELKAFWSRLHG
jgi:predicted transcriptional regulator